MSAIVKQSTTLSTTISKTVTTWCRSFFFRSRCLPLTILFFLNSTHATQTTSIQAPTQSLVGELLHWTEPNQRAEPFRKPVVEPLGSAWIHSQRDPLNDQKLHLFLIPARPGQILVKSPSDNQTIRTFMARKWPADPPAGGILAGVGPISGRWDALPDQPQAGDALQIVLRLNGGAAMAIHSAPKIYIRFDNRLMEARSLGPDLHWPIPGQTAGQIWKYEVPITLPGTYRVEPIRIHTWDSSLSTIQTKLVSGIHWDVPPSSIFTIPDSQSTPVKSQTRWRINHWRPLSLIICLMALAPCLAYHVWFVQLWSGFHLRAGLYRSTFCADKPSAQQSYRHLEPLLSGQSKTHKKSPLKWRAVDQLRLEELQRRAFGNPADQNPIR